MGCCGKQREKFKITIAENKEKKIQSLTEVPNEELSPRQLVIKRRMIHKEEKQRRIARRQIRANRIKARQDRKALNN